MIDIEPRENKDAIGPTISFVLIIVLCWLLSALLHGQYEQGYANGLSDGMTIGEKDGNTQGQYEAIVNLQQWEYQHGCAVSDGYVALKVVRDAQGKATFACEVKR
jgi:hypothetical protein